MSENLVQNPLRAYLWKEWGFSDAHWETMREFLEEPMDNVDSSHHIADRHEVRATKKFTLLDTFWHFSACDHCLFKNP